MDKRRLKMMRQIEFNRNRGILAAYDPEIELNKVLSKLAPGDLISQAELVRRARPPVGLQSRTLLVASMLLRERNKLLIN